MRRLLYPAVLERGSKGTFGAWFPDFPGCGAAGRSQEEAVEKAEAALALAVDVLLENDKALPAPTPIDRVELPKGCELFAYFIVGVDPPNPSERVNVYLPKNLIVRIDKRAAELGMTRSSFFGLATTIAIDRGFPPSWGAYRTEPRSKVQRTGGLRARKTSARKRSP